MNARSAAPAARRLLLPLALLAAGCSLIFDADEYDERTGVDAAVGPVDAGTDAAADGAPL